MAEENEPLEPVSGEEVEEAFSYQEKAISEFEGQFTHLDGPEEEATIELLRKNAPNAAQYVINLVNGRGEALSQDVKLITQRRLAATWVLERVLGKPQEVDSHKKWLDFAKKLNVASQES